jgi:mono/diheme cytochrome c family protein
MRKFGIFLLCVALLSSAVACSSSKPRLPAAPNGEPVVEVRGALRGGPYALGRADLDALPRLSVVGEEPRSGKMAVWEGTSVAALVAERVELRKGADTAIIRTADRAAIPVPLTMIRQLKPVLADRADGVRLVGSVLAWPTAHQKGLATDPRAGTWWARDVVAFDIVEWQRTFGPALAAPEGSAEGARRGASLYGDSCITCHRLRGVGGERGPDLTTVAARLRPTSFTALLPSHPGWRERGITELPPDAATELWTFLKAVADVAATPGAAPEQAPAEELAADRKPVAATRR